MTIIPITIEVILTDDQLRRLDAAAKWNDSTQESTLRMLTKLGIIHHIESGLTMMERTMSMYPDRNAALKAMEEKP